MLKERKTQISPPPPQRYSFPKILHDKNIKKGEFIIIFLNLLFVKKDQIQRARKIKY